MAGLLLNSSTCKLLLHMDGADAATAFTDSSPSTHTITTLGNAQVDTAQSKFGGSSALFDGTGDYLKLDGSSDFIFGTGDFTINFWYRPNSIAAGVRVLYDQRGLSDGAFPCIYQTTAELRYFYLSADRISSGAGVFSTGTWYHIALCRSGNATKMFINGTQVGSTYTDQTSIGNDGATSPWIGSDWAATQFTNGWIDELVVENGYARWTSNFTPPDAAGYFPSPSIYFGAQPVGWTPAELTGLVAWYIADTGVYSDAGTTLATTGQSVQQWNDQSGNGRHISQATSGNRPALQSTGLNSLQTIRFTAASATGLFSGATAIDISATTLSAFLVGKVRSASASDARILSLQSGASADSDSALRFTFYRPGTGAAFAAYRNLNGPLSQTSLTYDTATRLGLIFDSVNVTTYKDNVAGTPAATTGTFLSAGRLGVGQYTIVSQPLDGDISELVITNTALSAADRTLLDDYFRVKWGF